MNARELTDKLRADVVVELPSGRHDLDGDLVIDGPYVLRGRIPCHRTRGVVLLNGRLVVAHADARVEDVCVLGPGVQSAPCAAAVEVTGLAELTRVKVFDWPGRAFWVHARAADAQNASRARLTRCEAALIEEHAFVAEGPDANAVLFDQCDARDVGGVGFYDLSFLGCVYQACMAHACDEAGFSNDVRVTGGPDGLSGSLRVNANQSTLFAGCYCESDSRIRIGAPGIWVGAHNSKTQGNGLIVNGTRITRAMLAGARFVTADGKTWDLDQSIVQKRLVP